MREDEEFEHVNQVESYTRDQMWRMLHASRDSERAFYLSVVDDDGSEGELDDMEVKEEMTDGDDAAVQAMEVDDPDHENAGDSQQTSSSKAMGEGSPTPRKAPVPLPLPTPSSKRSLLQRIPLESAIPRNPDSTPRQRPTLRVRRSLKQGSN